MIKIVICEDNFQQRKDLQEILSIETLKYKHNIRVHTINSQIEFIGVINDMDKKYILQLI